MWKWWKWGSGALYLTLLPHSMADTAERRAACSCPYTSWSEWSKCDCPSGVSVRSLSCVDYSHNLGCNMLQQSDCPCPTDPIKSDPAKSTNHSASAGDTTAATNDILEPTEELQSPDDGECTCSDWADWAPCDCDLHDRKRWRYCTETGAGACATQRMYRMQTVNCECTNQAQGCACSEWADWSDCACSSNIQSRSRICDAPQTLLSRARREPANETRQFKLVSSSRLSDLDYCVAVNRDMSLGLALCGDTKTPRWNWNGGLLETTSGCITKIAAVESNSPKMAVSQCDSLNSSQIWKLTGGLMVAIDHADVSDGNVHTMATKSQLCLAVPRTLQRRHPGKHYFDYWNGLFDSVQTENDEDFTLTLEECDRGNDRQWWVIPEGAERFIQSDEGNARGDEHVAEVTCDASQTLTKDVRECVCARNGSIFNPDPQVIANDIKSGDESGSPNMTKTVVGAVFGALSLFALLAALGLAAVRQVRRKNMKVVQDGNVYRLDRGGHDLFQDPVIADLERNYVEPDYELFGSGDLGPAISV